LTVTLAVVAACGGGQPDTLMSPTPAPPVPGVVGLPVVAGTETLVAAGDVAICEGGAAAATARLLDGIGGTVAALGDLAYPSGTPEQFRDCYDPAWGRHRGRTRPVPGNHDYETPGAVGYFGYFGAAAGPPGRGYYSYDLGAWHIVTLNSNVAADGGSPQIAWLRRDLDASRRPCTLAYWHHPLFSSGPNGANPRMREAWRLLDDAGADVVLAGHDHLYERFAPQDAGGFADPNGIRQFTVGTGGVPLYPVAAAQANSEVRISAFGVLKLTLTGDSYAWAFVPLSGPGDGGSARCS
jgi:hypothetical protein